VTRILWSPQALSDLESIRDYIAHDSPQYAELVLRRLVAAVDRLETFPKSGRVVPERTRITFVRSS
jgi:plasmid stabilization system protein ParE